jgi:SAM-dependent methyltransferase
MNMQNIDKRTVRSFGEEWATFDQTGMPEAETRRRFAEYFSLIRWEDLPKSAIAADIGCGSGRWAALIAPHVATLYCVEASDAALSVARRNLAGHDNCRFYLASVDTLPFPRASLDLCYSLGVLHHVPDTQAGICACAAALKPGAPLLLYLYYDLSNRPWWFRAIWKATDLLRRGTARLPFRLKRVLSSLIAVFIYWPLARLAAVVERWGDPAGLPLSYYRDKSFYTMRTDAFDRFGTRLEHRFSRAQIEAMMQDAGLIDIAVSDSPPYWCAVGYRRSGV